MTPEKHRLPDPDDVPAVSAEQLVDGVEGPHGRPPRRYPSTLGGAFYLLVLAVAVVGLVVASAGSWRGGIRILGGSLLAAAVVRSLLRSGDAGMLAVRHRVTDIVLLVALGLALLVLAFSIPNQPG